MRLNTGLDNYITRRKCILCMRVPFRAPTALIPMNKQLAITERKGPYHKTINQTNWSCYICKQGTENTFIEYFNTIIEVLTNPFLFLTCFVFIK